MSTTPTARQVAANRASKSTVVGICINFSLAILKGTAGVLGNSYALVADAIESASDVVSSFVVWIGLRIASKSPTENHPYGRGRAEAIAGVVVSIALFLAAANIAISSIREIKTPHHAPEPFTLLVLVIVVLVKVLLFRSVFKVGEEVTSVAVKTDAWHHRSDAITSAAAFVGISVALIGGKGFESADDWAALVAAAVIAINASSLIRPALNELTDGAPDTQLVERVREIAAQIPGVESTHRCWIRKLGFDHFIDLDIVVNGDLTVREGHDIAHAVHDSIRDQIPAITKVMVHVEPSDKYGRFKLDWEA